MSAQCLYGVHKNWITGQTATWAAANNISFSELLIKFWELTSRELQVIDYKENTTKNVLVKPHKLIHSYTLHYDFWSHLLQRSVPLIMA